MFCTRCGSPNEEGARFCVRCGAAIKNAGNAAPAAAHPKAVSPGAAFPVNVRVRGGRIVPLLLSLLLAVYAAGQLALAVAGATATAVVTRYEQRLYVGQMEKTRDPTRYEVYYEFTAAGGKAYAGSATKSFPNGIVAPSDGTPQTVAVRYLPMLPHVNELDGQTSVLTGPLFLGLAALLFWLGTRKKRT